MNGGPQIISYMACQVERSERSLVIPVGSRAQSRSEILLPRLRDQNGSMVDR